jgi:hypothetical protein
MNDDNKPTPRFNFFQTVALGLFCWAVVWVAVLVILAVSGVSR